MYDFDSLLGYKKFNVATKSFEQFKNLMFELEQRSYLWQDGSRPTRLPNIWYDYKENTVVNIYDDMRLTFSFNRHNTDDDNMVFDFYDLDFNDSDKKISFEEIY